MNKDVKAVLGGFFLVFGILFQLFWYFNPHSPSSKALKALNSDSLVAVTETDDYTQFKPFGIWNNIHQAIIIYPDNNVLVQCYAPLARSLAIQGYTAILVPNPPYWFEQPSTTIDNIIDTASLSHVSEWYLAGHYQGADKIVKYIYQKNIGTEYAYGSQKKINGIILLGPKRGKKVKDISDRNLPAIKIVGTQDSLSSVDEKKDYRLPNERTRIQPIKGGNNMHFTSSQSSKMFDGTSTISPSRQIELTVQAIDHFIKDPIKKYPKKQNEDNDVSVWDWIL